MAASGSGRKPKPLHKLTRANWKRAAVRVYSRFDEVSLTDRAAALAYYGFLSLFPAFIVAIAVLALFGNYPETFSTRCARPPRDRPLTRSTRPWPGCCAATAPAACSASAF